MLIRQEYSNMCSLTMPEPSTQEDLIRRYPTACRPDNLQRNRFGDVLPEEETRVKLKWNLNYDYVNANIVEHHEVGRPSETFLCCQAPISTTFDDFWFMVWQQNSSIICALNPEFPTDVYWPDKKETTKNFSHFSASLESSYKFNNLGIVIRRICLQPLRHEASRTVFHIHYENWPDKGVPSSSFAVRELVHLVLWFRQMGYSKGIHGPCIIHCLAGLGRTGTFLSILLIMMSPAFQNKCQDSQFREFVNNLNRTQEELSSAMIPGYYVPPTDDNLDEIVSKFKVMDIVLSLRRQRNPRMVQTEEQYEFIYRALKDELKEPSIPSCAIQQLQSFYNLEKYRPSPTDLIPALKIEYPSRTKAALLLLSNHDEESPELNIEYPKRNQSTLVILSPLIPRVPHSQGSKRRDLITHLHEPTNGCTIPPILTKKKRSCESINKVVPSKRRNGVHMGKFSKEKDNVEESCLDSEENSTRSLDCTAFDDISNGLLKNYYITPGLCMEGLEMEKYPRTENRM